MGEQIEYYLASNDLNAFWEGKWSRGVVNAFTFLDSYFAGRWVWGEGSLQAGSVCSWPFLLLFAFALVDRFRRCSAVDGFERKPALLYTVLFILESGSLRTRSLLRSTLDTSPILPLPETIRDWSLLISDIWFRFWKISFISKLLFDTILSILNILFFKWSSWNSNPLLSDFYEVILNVYNRFVVLKILLFKHEDLENIKSILTFWESLFSSCSIVECRFMIYSFS